MKIAGNSSIKTRMTLMILMVLLVNFWALAFYVKWHLGSNMERLAGEQQRSVMVFTVEQLHREIQDRTSAIEKGAAALSSAHLTEQDLTQILLDRQNVLQGLFNDGIYVSAENGRILASLPPLSKRKPFNATGLAELIQQAQQQKTPLLADLSHGVDHPRPGVVIAMPILDQQGNIVGTLAGITDIGRPSFMDMVTENHYDNAGNFVLLSPEHTLYTDAVQNAEDRHPVSLGHKNLLLAPEDRTAGQLDAQLVSWAGRPHLVSLGPVPGSDWYLAALTPQDHALLPIETSQRNILWAMGLLTVITGAVMWWIIRAQLLPLKRASQKLANVTGISHPLRLLKVSRQDEVGTLLDSVNQMLQTIDASETALRLSESRFRQLIEWSTEAILVHRHGIILYVNPSAVRLLGASKAEEVLLQPLLGFIHPDFHDMVNSRMNSILEEEREAPMVEQRYIRIDGTVIDVEVQSKSIHYDAEMAVFSALRDITQQKHADESLRIAATAFESNQGTCITDVNGRILRVNKAFSKITGYMPEEVIGKSPAVLQSGRQDRNFYLMMWQALELTGNWQGEIWNRRKNGEIYPEWLNISAVRDKEGLTSHYVGSFSDITAHKQADEKIRNLAFFDPLTELPNRRLLIERLSQALQICERKQHLGVLMFVDLDNFKMINDTLGHASGDLLLQLVSRRLSSCVREGDTVARLGGDEFVVMLQDTTDREKEAIGIAEVVSQKILNVLNRPYKLGDAEHRSTPSVGITLFGGNRLETIDEPLKRADLAMYQAKAAGRNTVRFFDPTMQAVVSARAELEKGLRTAIDSDQFELHYQAQVEEPHHLTGVEALIRWKHPLRGLISPAEFIPVAEETGLILQIGEWVIEQACQQLVTWSTQPGFNDLTISVNVSARQFHQSDFAQQVLDILDRTGAPAQCLKLELTESLLVSNVEDVIRKMSLLQEAGVGFALDDFGTGYSSLSYLKRLPLWQLKIDRSFVRDILYEGNDAAISRMVVSLANNMGLTVIAEGVESEAQRTALAEIGCLSYQGYLYGRPLPVAEFESFARSHFLTPESART